MSRTITAAHLEVIAVAATQTWVLTVAHIAAVRIVFRIAVARIAVRMQLAAQAAAQATLHTVVARTAAVHALEDADKLKFECTNLGIRHPKNFVHWFLMIN